MKKRDGLIGADGEVRDLDDAFFARARRGRPPMRAGERKVRMNLMIEQGREAGWLDEELNIISPRRPPLDS